MAKWQESRVNFLNMVSRVRDYHIYSGNKRYLDMYLDGGRAILGHKPKKLNLEMKKIIDRGLYISYNSIYHSRLYTALKSLLPEYKYYYIYPELYSAQISLKSVSNTDLHLTDIMDANSHTAEWLYWRPFLPEKLDPLVNKRHRLPRFLTPLIPLPGCKLAIVASNENLSPPPPVNTLQTAASAFMVNRLIKMKNQKQTYDWGNDFSSCFWQQTGPYLKPRISIEKYQQLYLCYINEKIVLSPTFDQPSIAPLLFSNGELAKFKLAEKKFLVTV